MGEGISGGFWGMVGGGSLVMGESGIAELLWMVGLILSDWDEHFPWT